MDSAMKATVVPNVFAESDAYERFMGRWSRRLAPLFVKFVSVGECDSVLDVGSGTGALACAIADALPSTRVTGIDRSDAFVREAQARATSDRTRFQVGDAQLLEFPDSTFDTTVSILVMNFIPDPAKALREMIRVTRPGGLVAAAVWDYGNGMELLRVFWDEAVALDPSIAAHDERHMPLCGPGELAALWRENGLDRVEDQSIAIELSLASFDDYWRPFLGGQGPAGGYTVSLSDERRAAFEARLRTRLLGSGPDRPFTLHARAWAVKGRC
jgi:SAM-dependent methyltransferase